MTITASALLASQSPYLLVLLLSLGPSSSDPCKAGSSLAFSFHVGVSMVPSLGSSHSLQSRLILQRKIEASGSSCFLPTPTCLFSAALGVLEGRAEQDLSVCLQSSAWGLRESWGPVTQ